MRILFQYFQGGGGGLSNICVLLRTMAQSFPQDAFIVAARRGSPLLDLESISNVVAHPLRQSVPPELFRFWLGVSGLRQLARKERADIIWSMNLGEYSRGSVPQVISINNLYQVAPWKQTTTHPQSPFRVAALRWFFRRSLRSSVAAIVQTEFMAGLVRGIRGAPENVFVIAKAVENTADEAAGHLPPKIADSLAENRHHFTFLYAADLLPHKDHASLIDALELIRDSGVAARAVVTVEAEALTQAHPRASELLESGYVVAVGWVDRRHLRALYEACDACVIPSLLESLTSAHLEALAWRKPIVTVDLPHAREVCGSAALYASPRDPGSLARSMLDILENQDLRAHLRAAGETRRRAFPDTWEEVAQQVHVVLASFCLGQKQPRSGSARTI